MKLIIEIPEHIYEHAKNVSEDSHDEWGAMRAIANGLPYEQRPNEMWEHLKEHITELRDANGYATQYETCHFILNLMGVIEREGDEK